MADLNDYTVIPSMILCMGVLPVVIEQTMGWSRPVAIVVGFLAGVPLGVFVGLLLTATVITIIETAFKIQEKCREYAQRKKP